MSVTTALAGGCSRPHLIREHAHTASHSHRRVLLLALMLILSHLQRSSNAQPTLLQKLPGGGISVEAPKQNIAAGQAAVFAGLGMWAILQVCGAVTPGAFLMQLCASGCGLRVVWVGFVQLLCLLMLGVGQAGLKASVLLLAQAHLCAALGCDWACHPPACLRAGAAGVP